MATERCQDTFREVEIPLLATAEILSFRTTGQTTRFVALRRGTPITDAPPHRIPTQKSKRRPSMHQTHRLHPASQG